MKVSGIRLIAALAGAAAVAAGFASIASASPGAVTGPSTSTAPYVLRSTFPGVVTKSILTAGDVVGGYTMAGTPDGLGIFNNPGGETFTMLSNHEFVTADGAVRAHGAPGSFISKWTINRDDLSVTGGEDLIRNVKVWTTGGTPGWIDAPTVASKTFARFCSADLAPRTAFWNPATGKGYDGRIFLNGEETSGPPFDPDAGRAFANLLDGTSYQLPRLGRIAFENVVAHPNAGDKTIAIAMEDNGTTNSQVYIYAGTKTDTGNPVEKAGLNNGKLFAVSVAGLPSETNTTTTGGTFTVKDLGDVSSLTGGGLSTASSGTTTFMRPEDGAWDPTNPNVFYFNTTSSFTGRSKLWKLTFVDPTDPAKGGTAEPVLDGTEGQKMLDNMTINDRGQLVLQEDPGNQAYVSKIWLYTPSLDKLTEVARFDADQFTPGLPGFITQDEETSGVIDAKETLGRGWYLLDAQVHKATGNPFTVEMGQYIALHIPPGRS